MKKTIISYSEKDTIELGTKLTSILPSGVVVLLCGDLGAGKTTLVRGIAKGLNIKEVVQSPTFNIMKIYFKGDRPLIHIDAYRLADIDTDIGLDEYIGYESGITVIEWPDFIQKLLPDEVVRITLLRQDDNVRNITIESPFELGGLD